MPTALLILAAILPADGPPRVPADIRQATLAELLSGSWSGTWTPEGQTDRGVTVQKGVFTLPMNLPATMCLTITAEGTAGFAGPSARRICR